MNKNERCACGHRRSQHTTYIGGTNRKGSVYVCTKDGCTMWADCDLTDDKDSSTKPH